MGKYVTSGGFKRPTLDEIKSQLEEGFKGVFGPSFDTNQDSPNGYLIAMLARTLGNVYELGQEVYDAHTTAGSTGSALDDILTLCYLHRLGESPTTGRATLYTEDASAEVSVPKGTKFSSTRGYVFTLDSQVTIASSVNEIKFNVGTPSGSAPYTFEFGGYTINIGSGSMSATAVASTLVTAINNGGYSFHAKLEDDTIVSVKSDVVAFVYSLPEFCEIQLRGADGYFSCTDMGPNQVAEGELNTIVDSVDGLDSVRNDKPMQSGSYAESDSSARIRLMREAYTSREFGTDKSIAARLVNDVNGVVYAVVTSNRGMVTDSDGRPPKSFEAVVTGGSDEDVARCIFDNSCCGIESYGTTSVIIIDGNGDEQLVRFSRPQPVYLWIDVTGVKYSEEAFASDGIAHIKKEIVAWANKEYSIGKDVISDRVKVPIYSVEGVGRVNVKVGIATSESASKPSMSENTIPVSSSSYAVVSASRISVTLT